MIPTGMRRFTLSLAATANLLLLDQASKSAAIGFLKGAEPVALAPFFNLAYVENRGCAWGMLQGHVWPLAVFAVVAFAFILWKRKSIFPQGWAGFAAENLLYAGILGNLVDRLFRGYVVDMFDFHIASSHFPCFNVADSCITLAAAVMIALSFRRNPPVV